MIKKILILTLVFFSYLAYASVELSCNAQEDCEQECSDHQDELNDREDGLVHSCSLFALSIGDIEGQNQSTAGTYDCLCTSIAEPEEDDNGDGPKQVDPVGSPITPVNPNPNAPIPRPPTGGGNESNCEALAQTNYQNCIDNANEAEITPDKDLEEQLNAGIGGFVQCEQDRQHHLAICKINDETK